MSSRLKLAGICFAAAFALAACGGGGGDTARTPDPDPTPQPVAPTPSEQVSDLFAKVSTYEKRASDAQKAAEDALEDAETKAGMLGAVDVKGESATAEANAQAVLDAVGDVETAVMNAESALMALKQAKTDADALPEDTANLAQLKTDIDNAIEAAEDNLEAAEGIRDDRGAGSLAAHEATIKGANGKKTAAMWGMEVAASIKTGLDAYAIGTTHAAALAAVAPTVKNRVSMNDAPANAMTWAMIVGEDKVMKKRLGTVAADGALTPGNGEVSVASLEGMTATDVAPDGTDLSTTGNTDGDATTGGTYMGILGAVVCLGGSDGCKVTDGKLGAGWYFSPAAPTQRYRHKVGVGYEAFDDYASYGYWLVVDGDGAVTGFNTFATSTADNTNTGAGISPEDIGDDKGKATYSGSAAGMSVVTAPNAAGTGREPSKSGAFTADVTLNATFGASPTVDGAITNFRGDAVGSGWRVTLRSQDLAATGSITGATRTDGQADDGLWSAQPYGGSSTARPGGIHGGFNANFRDGMAVGAYATRKD